MKKWLKIAATVIVVGCMLLSCNSLCFKQYKNAHKMLMPNKYRVYLKDEEYIAVNFFKWKKLDFESKPEKCSLSICDEDGQCLPLDPSPASKPEAKMENVHDYIYGSQDGPVSRYHYTFYPLHAGWYIVQCGEKSIWVIFPEQDFYIKESSWPAYPGCENISDFEHPVKGPMQ